MGTLTIGADRVWKTIVSRYKMAAWQSFWIGKKWGKKFDKKFEKKIGIVVFMHVKLLCSTSANTAEIRCYYGIDS